MLGRLLPASPVLLLLLTSHTQPCFSHVEPFSPSSPSSSSVTPLPDTCALNPILSHLQHCSPLDRISSPSSPPDPSPSRHWSGPHGCLGRYCIFAHPANTTVAITTLANVALLAGLLPSAGSAAASPEPFEPAPVPGAGTGLVLPLSSAPLSRSPDPVLARQPTLLLSRSFFELPPSPRKHRLIDAAVAVLPEPTRLAFLSQLGHEPQLGPELGSSHDHDRAAAPGAHAAGAIIATNSFQLSLGDNPADPSSHHYASFLTTNLINHSCRPNAAFRICPGTLTHVVVPSRLIQPGEQLTISYLDPLVPTAQRQQRAALWGFRCSCPACADSSASDARLAEISALTARLGDLSAGVTLRDAHRLVELYAAEGLESVLATAYTLAAFTCSLLGEEGCAVKYGELAVQAGIIEGGEEAEDVRLMRVMVANVKKHYTWKLRLANRRSIR